MTEFSEATLRGIRCAVDILKTSSKGVVLSGAGISTPSGIPDFRSTDSGLWERYDPFEVASLAAFRYRPEKFFDWIRPLAMQMQGAEPNVAHLAVAKLEEAGIVKTVITQNIDRLHQRAGSKNVLEVHGSMGTLTCIGCYTQVEADSYVDRFIREGEIPHCPVCGDILKPDVVLYGEQLPVRVWLKAQKASRTCDVMIVAGSSLEVLPVAGLPMRALENGAHLIIVNHSETYLDVRADVVFHEDVARILPRIATEVLREKRD
ncbi:MAG: NAD-dependent deacylase [Anaerolineales bacterium]|jgi:NAD-dependent deacetylase